ncbi:MAG: hypothetical protein IAE65_04950 [Ignavibacteria bacterium]|nr:hypothetical protein [Ignavibacteria bacterium]
MKTTSKKNSKINIIHLDFEDELKNIINKIDRDFLIYKCKQFNVRHSKYDSFATLCKKFLNKNAKMKSWDMPDDEYGIAGFVSPQFTIEHLAILYGYAKEYDKAVNNPDSKNAVKNVYDKLCETLKTFIEMYEYRQFLYYFRDDLKNLKIKKRKSIF